MGNAEFCDSVERNFPIELEIKDPIDTFRFVSYLDSHLEIDNNDPLRIILNEKRDDFSFPFLNFLFLAETFQQRLYGD